MSLRPTERVAAGKTKMVSILAGRQDGLAGVAFVGLFIGSLFAGGSDLGGPDFPAEVIADDLAERSDGLMVSASMVGPAAIAGYWFVAALVQRLAAKGQSRTGWVTLVGGAATVTVVLAEILQFGSDGQAWRVRSGSLRTRCSDWVGSQH